MRAKYNLCVIDLPDKSKKIHGKTAGIDKSVT